MLNFYNWWALNIGRVNVPKFLYKTHRLIMCDYCGENLIGKTAQVVDHGWFKRIWQSDDKQPRLGYLYAHKNKSDCDANRYFLDEKYPNKKDI